MDRSASGESNPLRSITEREKIETIFSLCIELSATVDWLIEAQCPVVGVDKVHPRLLHELFRRQICNSDCDSCGKVAKK